MSKKELLPMLRRAAAVLFPLAVSLLLGYFLLSRMLPFLIAWLFASLLQPPVRWILRHTRLQRTAASSIVTFGLLLLVLVVSSLLLWQLAAELVHVLSLSPGWLAAHGPVIVQRISDTLEALLSHFTAEWADQFRILAQQLLTGLQSEAGRFSAALIDWAASLAAALPSFVLSFFVTLLGTFFMTIEYQSILSFLQRQLPRRFYALLQDAGKTLRRTIGRLLQSYFLLLLLMLSVLTIGLVVLGVQDALFWAVLLALLDLIPVLGMGAVLLPWAAYSLFSGNVPLGVGLLLLELIAAVLRNFFEPRMLGNRLGIHPLAALAAMYLGFRMFGVFGMALFPLILLLLKDARTAGLLPLWKERERET